MRLRSGTRFEDQDEAQPVQSKHSSSKSNSSSKKKPNVTNGSVPSKTNHKAGETERNGVFSERPNKSNGNIERPSQNDRQHQNTKTKDTGSSREIRPHGWWTMLLLKASATFLVFMYFGIPTIIRLYPWLLAEFTFLHHLRWPPFINLKHPADLGLNHTHHFHIPSSDEVVLGAWHTLPASLQGEPVTRDTKALLGSGDPIMIYFHGNAGTRAANHRVSLYKLLAKSGFHVLTIDYRGYGDSTGYPTETGVVDDAHALYRWVKRHRAAKAPIYIWGHSLGTAVSTQLARRLSSSGDPYEALILEAPFNSFIEAALTHPISLPFRYMPYFTWVFIEPLKALDISFETDKNIARVEKPIFIVHAKDDSIVPFELGERLYETAQQSGRQVTFHGLDGNHGYGHKHIHKCPELIPLLRKFLQNITNQGQK